MRHTPRRVAPWPDLGRAVATAVALALPVAALAALVRLEYGPLVLLDESTILAATDLARSDPVLRDLLLAWQVAFQAVWVNLVALTVCVLVGRRPGMRARALWAAATILVSWALALGLKHVVGRGRPVVEDAVSLAPGFSFPSGHVSNITTVVTALLVLLWPLTGRGARVWACAAAGVLVLVTAADRVLLGVHYPSDTLAGVAFGVAVVLGSWWGYTGWSGRRSPPPAVER